MKFKPLSLSGAYLIELDPLEDNRGFFARSFCRDEFKEKGLCSAWVQSNISFNKQKGIIRGLHFQKKPKEETKLIRCTSGKIFDVIVDLRKDSPTFKKWAGVELSAENHVSLYVPAGLAHGFQTLTDESEVFYEMSDVFDSSLSSGVRWNDPTFNIAWPLPNPSLSDKDINLLLFKDLHN